MSDADLSKNVAHHANSNHTRMSGWDAFLTFAPLGVAALAIRAVIAPLVGHPIDMYAFIEWGRSIADVGFDRFYQTHPTCDYLPGYLYVLWACGKIAGLVPPQFHYLIFKLPNMIADVCSAWIVWRLSKPTTDQPRLIWPALYLLNPVIIFNSAYWGQADSYHAFVVLSGLALCRNQRFVLSALVLGYACTVKPHSIVIVPLVIVTACLQGIGIARLLGCCFVAVGTFFAAFAMFASESSSNPASLALERIRITMDLYPYATVNALNLWYACGKNWVVDSTLLWGIVSIRTVAVTLVLGGAAFLLRQLTRAGDALDARFWRIGAALFFVTFLFSTRVHERHIYPAFVLLLCAAPKWSKALYVYAILSLTCFLNMAFAWSYIDPQHRSAQLHSIWLTSGLCVLNFVAFALVFQRFRSDQTEPDSIIQRIAAAVESFAKRATGSNGVILAGIIVFAFGTRVARLDQPDTRVFDEVYHAYTAEQWAKGNADAWRWDTETPDKDCAYEWTHPPLAKLIMTGSIRLLGPNAFAWRLPAALLGTICIYLVYAIGRKLFSSDKIGLLAASFMALDTLPLLMSRIAMNDIYCVVFILAGVLACLKQWHVRSAVLIGCAIACKWTGMFALPLLFIIRIQTDNETLLRAPVRSALKATVQIAIIVMVYVGSYTPFFRAGNGLADFFELQGQMWGYHTRADLEHDGASKAWQWPLGEGALWLYTDSEEPDSDSTAGSIAIPTTSNIYAMGNPMIWWPGLGAIAFCILQSFKRPSPQLVIAILGYLIFWVPWIVSPRIMFIYHYLPALPFLYLLLAWSLIVTKMDARVIRLMVAIAALALALESAYVAGIPLPVP